MLACDGSRAMTPMWKRRACLRRESSKPRRARPTSSAGSACSFRRIPRNGNWSINEVIREMIVLLRGEATRYSIAIRTELAADPLQVMGDRVQLQQVMMNLMINGTDAMKDVNGTRELAITSQPADNEEILVSVSDTGLGLPSQQADQIFKAFFTTKPHGTGMGLSISRSIVESHGGRLWAGRNSPRGASFYFTLPSKAQVPDKPTVPA